MSLRLEMLERRCLLAAPIKPWGMELLAADDSGAADDDDITNVATGTVEFIAERDTTVRVYNAGYLGEAVGQGDTLFFGSNTIVIEAERGTIAGAMITDTSVPGYVGAGYVQDTAATPANPALGGSLTYTFYVGVEAEYYVHARVYYPNGSQNSFFVNINDVWEAGDNGPGIAQNTFNTWHFNTATTEANGVVKMSWHLTVGWHTLQIHGRESGSIIDRLVISTNDTAPGGNGGDESVLYETYRYTFAPGELLGSNDGTVNYITASAENLDGVSPLSDAFALTYDSGAATPGPPALHPASDTGHDNTDNITNDTTPTFIGGPGSVEPNSAVTLRVDGVDTRTTTANADGSYSISLLAGDLAEGPSAIDIYYVDIAGNVSADSADLVVTLLTLAPAPAAAPELDPASDTGVSDSDNITRDTTALLTGPAGTVPANSTVWVRVGGVARQSTTANPDGSYDITLNQGILAEGVNNVDIVYIDAAGNISPPSLSLAITIDTVSDQPAAPELISDPVNDTGVSQVDNITKNANCTITGAAEAWATVHIFVNGAEVNAAAADAGGNWSYTFLNGDLAEGVNTITVTAVDSHGNPPSIPSNPLLITLDRIIATPAAPDLRAASDTGVSDSDNITSDDAAWFDGFAEPGATVQLFVGAAGKGTATAHPTTGAWSIQLSNGDLSAGANNITVTATDVAGNSATSPPLVVIYVPATDAPPAPQLWPASDSGVSNNDNITNIAAATVYGSAAAGNTVDPGATVHVRTNQNGGGWVEVGTTVADAAGNWSYTFNGVDDLAEGTNLVDVFLTDLAGNQSSDSANLTITLDLTAAPPATAPNLDAASDTGVSDSDNITNAVTPTFNGPAGSVEGNSIVTLRVSGASVRTTTANPDGSYSITMLAGDLAEGVNLVDIFYTDLAGNISANSPQVAVTLDTTTFAPVAPRLDPASDTGVSNSDNLTNDITPTFTGPAGAVEGNSIVTLRVGGAPVRTTTANADGSYSVTVLAGDLAEGANVIDITYTDLAGNTSTDSDNLTVTLDTVIADPAVPELAAASDTGASDSDNVTAETRPTVQGAAGAVEGHSRVHVYLDTPSAPEVLAGTAAAAADGSWSYAFTGDSPLEEGVNLIRIVAMDQAGNTSNPSGALAVTVDFDTGAIAAPNLAASSDTGISNADKITKDTTPTITGVSPELAQIRLRVNGAQIFSFADNDGNDINPTAGQWSYVLPVGALVEGANTIDFLTVDAAGNTSQWSRSLIVTLDTVIEKPATPVLSPASDTGANNADGITNDTTPTITGVAEANSVVAIDINAGSQTAAAAVGADGTWSYTVPDGWLNEGENVIFVTATDVAGNVSVPSDSLTIILDTIINPPSAPELAVPNDSNATGHRNPRVTGTADPHSTIQVRLEPNGAAVIVGQAWADAAGDFSFIFPEGVLAEGANEVDFVATDIAGNTINGPSTTITVVTAISAPDNIALDSASDTGDFDDDNLTNKPDALITGTADPDCNIHILVNGIEVGTTVSSGAGDWDYVFNGVDDLIEGSNIIRAYATDAVGNVSAHSAYMVIQLDTTVDVPRAPSLHPDSQTGPGGAEKVTNIETITITGDCEPDATILLHLNGVDGFASVADADDGSADGRWSYTFAPGDLVGSANGFANVIKAAQRDAAGNLSAYGEALIVVLDNGVATPVAPELAAATDTGIANDDNLTNNRYAIVTGTVEPGSRVEVYMDRGAGPVLVDTISERLVDSGHWSYTFTGGQLAEGPNSVSVRAIDQAGNVSEMSAALVITLDTTISRPAAPQLDPASDTGLFDDDNVTTDTTPTILGTADPDVFVTVRVDGADINTVVANNAGVWTYTFAAGELADGVRRIDVVAMDAAGNISTASPALTVYLNTQMTQPAAPNLQAASDSGSSDTDNITNITTLNIDGRVTPEAIVNILLNGAIIGTTTADADGAWSYTFAAAALNEGENEIAIATGAGATLSGASFPLVIILDTTAPTAARPTLSAVSDTGVADNITADRTPTIEGLAEPGALVDVYHDDVHLARVAVADSGLWSYTFAFDQLQAGVNRIHTVVTDIAGNVSEPSAPLELNLDIEPATPERPALDARYDSGVCDQDGLTNNPHGLLTGNAKAYSSIAIFVDDAMVGETNADADGLWQFRFLDGHLAEGRNYVEAVATDLVGNVTRSDIFLLTLDTTPPIIHNHFPRGVYAQTSSVIELYLNTGDLDALAAADTSGYTLIGAGGDGTFDNGNEWIIPITWVNMDPLTGLVQLYPAITLSNDDYQLRIRPATSLRDRAGNAAQLNLAAAEGSGANPVDEEILLSFTIATDGPSAPGVPQLHPDSDSGVNNQDGVTNIVNPLVQLTAASGAAVEIICNGRSAGFAQETAPGEYQLYLPETLLRSGENLLMARAFDEVGNSSALSGHAVFELDVTPPRVAGIAVEPLWINTGPTQISIILEAGDIDPAGIANLDAYRIVASGGDGTFDDGNATYVTPTAVSYQAATRSIILTLPQTTTGASQLGPDSYRVSVIPGLLTDRAGNVMDVGAEADFAVVSAVTITAGQNHRFTTGDGVFSVILIGAGQVQVLLGADIGSPNLIERLSVTGTSAASVLYVTAHPGVALDIGTILIDSPLRVFSAAGAHVTERIVAEGAVAHFTVGALADNVSVQLTAPQGGVLPGMTLHTAAIGTDVSISIDGTLRSFRADSFASGSLSAAAVGTAQITAGGCGSDWSIAGNIDQLLIRSGTLSGNIAVGGRLGFLQTATLNDAQITAAQIGRIMVSGSATDTVIRSEAGIDTFQGAAADRLTLSAATDIGRALFTGAVTDSIIAAGGDLKSLTVLRDAVDNLFLAGLDLGADVLLGTADDILSPGNINSLIILGNYRGSTSAAGVAPGPDGNFFTADDLSAASGHIRRIMLTPAALRDTAAAAEFGFIAPTSLPTIIYNGQRLQAPATVDSFHLMLLA